MCNTVYKEMQTNMKKPCMGTTKQRFVPVWMYVTMVLCTIYSTNAEINANTVIQCLPREYKFNATKTIVSNGQTLSCWDIVTVYSCWGRCDSFEYGDYKIPYKKSYHPVCTYTGKVSRQVRLQHCHPDFPNPFYSVFDASGCGCKICDTDYTSCENLNG